MTQFKSTGNILDNVPNNGTIGLSAIVESCLITKFPNTIQNGLNKVNKNCTVPRNTRRGNEKRKRKRNLEQKTQGESKTQTTKE